MVQRRRDDEWTQRGMILITSPLMNNFGPISLHCWRWGSSAIYSLLQALAKWWWNTTPCPEKSATTFLPLTLSTADGFLKFSWATSLRSWYISSAYQYRCSLLAGLIISTHRYTLINTNHCPVKISRHTRCSQLCRDELNTAVSSRTVFFWIQQYLYIFDNLLSLNQVLLCLETKTFRNWSRMLLSLTPKTVSLGNIVPLR